MVKARRIEGTARILESSYGLAQGNYYAARTLARKRRTSPSRLSAPVDSASAIALTSTAVARASLEAPATRLIAAAPVRASPEASATPSAIVATALFCSSTVLATVEA